MESKWPDDTENSKGKLTLDQSNEGNLDQEEDKRANDNAINESDPRNTNSDDVSEKKSYPGILEAKPQHFVHAILNLAEQGKIKDEDNTNTSNLDDGEIPVGSVMLPTDTADGSTTIVQYAVTPKIEGEQIQVKLFAHKN